VEQAKERSDAVEPQRRKDEASSGVIEWSRDIRCDGMPASVMTVHETQLDFTCEDMISFTGWAYQNASHSSLCMTVYKCLHEMGPMYLSETCRPRRWLAVVNCVHLTVDNWSFLATD